MLLQSDWALNIIQSNTSSPAKLELVVLTSILSRAKRVRNAQCL